MFLRNEQSRCFVEYMYVNISFQQTHAKNTEMLLTVIQEINLLVHKVIYLLSYEGKENKTTFNV